MALRHAALLLLLALALVAEAPGAASAAPNARWGLPRLPSHEDGGLGNSSGMCNGVVGECVDEDEETGMESHISRRGLYGRVKYISYGALTRDRVPCNRRGQSYYNCNRRGRANPYRRGCSVITRCARFLH